MALDRGSKSAPTDCAQTPPGDTSEQTTRDTANRRLRRNRKSVACSLLNEKRCPAETPSLIRLQLRDVIQLLRQGRRDRHLEEARRLRMNDRLAVAGEKGRDLRQVASCDIPHVWVRVRDHGDEPVRVPRHRTV